MRSSLLFLLCGILVAFGFQVSSRGYMEPTDTEVFSSEEKILDSLRAKQKLLLSRLGAKHPSVIALQRNISELEERIQRNAEADNILYESIDQMSDQELRTFIGDLTKRLLQLEREVDLLKNPQDRFEFSGK